jgi:hypothetical protein
VCVVRVVLQIMENNYDGSAQLVVSTISVAGLAQKPKSVMWNGQSLPVVFESSTKLLTINGLRLSMGRSWKVTWTY